MGGGFWWVVTGGGALWVVVVGGGGGADEVVVTAVVAAVVVVTAAPPLDEVVALCTTVLLFLTTRRFFLCVVVVLVVVDDFVVFVLEAAGVVDPPDPHPAIRTAMAMAEIRIRFMGPPLVSSLDGRAAEGNNTSGPPSERSVRCLARGRLAGLYNAALGQHATAPVLQVASSEAPGDGIAPPGADSV